MHVWVAQCAAVSAASAESLNRAAAGNRGHKEHVAVQAQEEEHTDVLLTAHSTS